MASTRTGGGLPGTREPLVSAVVAAKNRPDALQALIASLREQDYPALEVVVVDDGSDPPLPPLEGVVQLRNEASVGASAARNAGFAKARGEYIFLFDDDCWLPDPDTIRRAVALAERNPRLGALAFRELHPEGEGYVTHSIQPAWGESLRFSAAFFAGMCLLRREAIAEIGGFTRAFGYYYEEVEMSLRLWDAGYTILYDPRLQVVHCEDARGRDAERICRLLLRNALYTMVMRYPWWYALPAAGVHLVRHLRTRRAQDSAPLRGVLWTLAEVGRNLPLLLRERQPVRYRVIRLARRLNRSRDGTEEGIAPLLPPGARAQLAQPV